MSNGLPTSNAKLSQAMENPLIAPMQSLYVTLREGVELMVSNTHNNSRLDVWLIMEKFTQKQEVGERVIFSFVDVAIRHTDAMDKAQRYARAVYNKDVSALWLPF